MTAQIRKSFVQLLATTTGREVRRVKAHGSHSLIEAGAGGALFLLRAGTLDRENRMTTAIRGVDLQTLAARRVAGVAFLCEAFGGPVIVPVRVLLARLNPAQSRVVLHVCLGAGGEITLVETGHDLRAYRGEAGLRRLIASRSRKPVPTLSHAQWQTIVAGLGQLRGYCVHVPAADRSRLDRKLASGSDMRSWAELPPRVARMRTLRFADVVLSRPGAPWPRWVCEVEEGGNIAGALARHAHTLATLREVGASWFPTFVVIAAARRRQEFMGKLHSPLFTQVGLTERCVFWPYDAAWSTHRRLRRRRVIRQLAARSGSRVAELRGPSEDRAA